MKLPAIGEVWMRNPDGPEVTVVHTRGDGTSCRFYAVGESKTGDAVTISEGDVQREVWIPKQYIPQMVRLKSIANGIFDCPEKDLARLRQILDEAQNRHPDGKADGSVSEESWKAFDRLARAIDEFNHALWVVSK